MEHAHSVPDCNFMCYSFGAKYISFSFKNAHDMSTDAADSEPLAPKALAAERPWEGSESRVPPASARSGGPSRWRDQSPGPAQPRPRYAQ